MRERAALPLDAQSLLLMSGRQPAIADQRRSYGAAGCGEDLVGRTRVGVINVTGYAGAELARILARPPAVDLVEVTGRSTAGEPLARSFAHLAELGMTIRE